MADEPTLPRVELLRKAATIVSGDRDTEYGAPEDNLGRIAKLWSVIFEREITGDEVAMAMIAVKLSRLVHSNGSHSDSWVDIAGYAAIGSEIKQKAEG